MKSSSGNWWQRSLICLACGCSATGALAEPRDAVSIFAGQMTEDSWDDIFEEPGGIDWEQSWLGGMALSRDWPIYQTGLSFGVEGQALIHAGDQSHLEFNLPVVLRYRLPPNPVPVSGAAFGIGLSWASEVPEIEVERKGDSQRLLVYWMIELELGRSDWDLLPFLRVHHRSDGESVADFDTGSNAVLAGLRYRF
ncbi:MAG: hypothetical protein AAGH83_09435 [Pseudomonadota bacterium]